MGISSHIPNLFTIRCGFCGHDGPCEVEIETQTSHNGNTRGYTVEAFEQVRLLCPNCRQSEEIPHDYNKLARTA